MGSVAIWDQVGPASASMILGLKFGLLLPEAFQETSWLSSLLLMVQGVLAARGLQGLWQDCRRPRRRVDQPQNVPAAAPVAPPAPAPMAAAPVAPPAPAPMVPPPAPAPRAEPAPAPPRAAPEVIRVHHHKTTRVLPDKVFATDSASTFHMFRDCQHIKSLSSAKTKHLCQTCQRKHLQIEHS